MNNGRLFVNGTEYFALSARDILEQQPYRLSDAIFISHQNGDAELAVAIAQHISHAGPPCYIDVLDPNVDGDSPQLESYLRRVIGNCSALLAVVSNATVNSWWVSLEIGVALDREKHIGTYRREPVTLPSYLWQWPVMDTATHIAGWAKAVSKYTPTSTHRVWREKGNQVAFFNAI